MNANTRHVLLMLAAGFVMLWSQLIPVSAETGERTVRGTVLATNLTTEPQTIVVTVPLANKDALIVGARVPTGTPVTRGTQAARLGDVKPGESAEITYRKGSDGLVARSIHVR